jgi:hypothetical protein
VRSILLVLLFSFFSQKDNLELCQISDGTYIVMGRDDKFIFEEGVVTVINQGQRLKYRIQEDEDQTRLIPMFTPPPATTEVEKALNSLGTPFYILTDCKADTINFKLMRNLHITISNGKMVLVD